MYKVALQTVVEINYNGCVLLMKALYSDCILIEHKHNLNVICVWIMIQIYPASMIPGIDRKTMRRK